MATRCIDNKLDFELVNINTSDQHINDIANAYIHGRHINVVQSTGFSCLLNHISNNIHVDKNNPSDLVYWFNIYIELCAICNILPDMTGYSYLIDVPYDTMKEWLSGEARSTTHSPIVKKMRDFCKNNCVAEAARGNVGAIYVSKAIHGLSDSAPATTYTQNNLYINAPTSREQIAAEFGGLLADNSSVKEC